MPVKPEGDPPARQRWLGTKAGLGFRPMTRANMTISFVKKYPRMDDKNYTKAFEDRTDPKFPASPTMPVPSKYTIPDTHKQIQLEMPGRVISNQYHEDYHSYDSSRVIGMSGRMERKDVPSTYTHQYKEINKVLGLMQKANKKKASSLSRETNKPTTYLGHFSKGVEAAGRYQTENNIAYVPPVFSDSIPSSRTTTERQNWFASPKLSFGKGNSKNKIRETFTAPSQTSGAMTPAPPKLNLTAPVRSKKPQRPSSCRPRAKPKSSKLICRTPQPPNNFQQHMTRARMRWMQQGFYQ